MIFTLEEWHQVEQNNLVVSAAPIGPDELGRNSKYVFALPPRYTFSADTGVEEVTEIMRNMPLHPF